MEKIKSFIGSEAGKNTLIVSIVILVGLGSFELGRLSKEADSSSIKIEYPSGATQASAISSIDANTPKNPVLKVVSESKSKIQKIENTLKNFFASSRGNKYYPVGCSAGKSIKLENRIYFATTKEAEGAGYELSGSCD